MTTGERIKYRRKRIGMSAEKLAPKLGVSPATIYRWEKGDIEKVPATILEPLADALQTTPEYLMGWSDLESAEVSPRARLHAIFDQVPEEKVDLVIHILESILEDSRK